MFYGDVLLVWTGLLRPDTNLRINTVSHQIIRKSFLFPLHCIIQGKFHYFLKNTKYELKITEEKD